MDKVLSTAHIFIKKKNQKVRDKARELDNFLQSRGINTLIVEGEMCIRDRKARVAALQILFQMDMRDKKLEEVLPYFKVPKGWDEDKMCIRDRRSPSCSPFFLFL